mgnify:CR=1 FL=1|jgi:hypothetical protein|tara:strand:+ start:55 stop:282 length:228 start_codon:yes stop_codon:yes gene_type:complete
MDEQERSALQDEDMLFTLLTAIVKLNGGEIRISEDEMDSVTTKDMVMLYYDKPNKELILSTHFLKNPSLNKEEVH